MPEPSGLFTLGVGLLTLGEVIKRRLRQTQTKAAPRVSVSPVDSPKMGPALSRGYLRELGRTARGYSHEPLTVDEVLLGARRRHVEAAD